ncbi:MAG: hypothetical protein ABR981_05885 [Candidatus Micrarchaeaceae archaeon]|jgi:hypothetical protein
MPSDKERYTTCLVNGHYADVGLWGQSLSKSDRESAARGAIRVLLRKPSVEHITSQVRAIANMHGLLREIPEEERSAHEDKIVAVKKEANSSEAKNIAHQMSGNVPTLTSISRDLLNPNIWSKLKGRSFWVTDSEKIVGVTVLDNFFTRLQFNTKLDSNTKLPDVVVILP